MATQNHIIPGQKFGRLTAIEEMPAVYINGKRRRRLSARCECGTERAFDLDKVRTGHTKSCGCLSPYTHGGPMPIEFGQRFGRLVYFSDAEYWPNRKNRRVKARCDCGSIGEYWLVALRRKTTISCGCFGKSIGHYINKTHGHSRVGKITSEYRIWSNMLTRCRNPKSKAYPDYGGRGITVCDRWLIFENFLADMGERPSSKHSIDRVENDDGYNPRNCRWATPKEQGNNKRNNLFLEYAGKRQTLSQWAEEVGIEVGTLGYRVHRLGWSIERALTQPLRSHRPYKR